MRWYVIVETLLMLMALMMGASLFVGEVTYQQLHALQDDLKTQQQRIQLQHAQNERLKAQRDDWTQNQETLEEHARYDLGMIKKNEHFIYTPRHLP